MPRRDGPSTMRNVSGYEVGLPTKWRSGIKMNADVKDRAASKEIAVLVERNPDLGHRVHKMICEDEFSAVAILAALKEET